jgi:hypothetical protein
MENQKKLQLQKLFQIIPSLSTKFPGFFSHPSYFSVVNSVSGDLISLWKRICSGPLVNDHFLHWGPPVGAPKPHGCHDAASRSFRARAPTLKAARGHGQEPPSGPKLRAPLPLSERTTPPCPTFTSRGSHH